MDCVRDVEFLENIKVQYHAESSSDLIAEIQRTIGQMTTEKEIHITTGLPPVTLRTDRQLLLRVVENLIQNALRYASRRIEIDFTDDADHLLITVRDDGRGFSASDLVHWGTRFYSSEKGRGHFGIGLFVSRLLCEKLGGSLTAGNNETGGAWTLIKIPK